MIPARVRPALLALAAGLAAAFAHPPFGLLPGLLGYGILMHLIDRAASDRPLRSSFWRGWLAGVGYFAVSTWWVGEAFLVDIAAHGWMAPIAVTMMATGLALFWGLGALLYRLGRNDTAWRVLVFAGAFSLAEWLRGTVLTGLPWNLPGATWRAGGLMSQTASLVGVYGLTFITLALSAAAVAAFLARGRARVWTGGAAVLVLVAMIGFGSFRFAITYAREASPRIRIVQANVEQVTKYDRKVFADIFRRYIALTAQPGEPRPDIVIWPEGAVPAAANDYLAPGTWTRAEIAKVLAPGQVLLVGAARYERTPGDPRFFNSLIALRGTGADIEILGVYDKYRLVPFGEYLPAKPLLGAIGFKELAKIGDGFDAGPRPRPMVLPGLPVIQPLICYESLYSGFTREGVKASGQQPRLLVNLSNDAWFGATSGPWQHLNLASYRAIEEGVPMVRTTPTGVSAMIDAYGRIVPGKRLGQRISGVIDASLPPLAGETLYRRLGNLPFLLFLIIAGVVTGVFRLAERRKPD